MCFSPSSPSHPSSPLHSTPNSLSQLNLTLRCHENERHIFSVVGMWMCVNVFVRVLPFCYLAFKKRQQQKQNKTCDKDQGPTNGRLSVGEWC